MIGFSCKCGHRYDVPEDQAGAMTQCPDCGLLCDIPTADELAWLEPDGAMAVDADPARAPAPGQTLAEMYRTFSRARDRSADDDSRRSLGHRTPNVQTHEPQRIAPQYDPETGERIVPLSLKEEAPQPVLAFGVEVDPVDLREEVPPPPPPRRSRQAVHIRAAAAVAASAVEPLPVEAIAVEPLPVEAIPVEPIPVQPLRPSVSAQRLTYAVGDAARPATLSSIAVDLLVRPANLTVLMFVGGFYAAAFLAKLPLDGMAGFFGWRPITAQLFNLPLWALVAHYGCVVEDLGPDGIDELPRPLRNFSVGDDLFAPALRIALAIGICFGPAIAAVALAGTGRSSAIAVSMSLGAAGTYLFPAVVLTLLTGTTVLNLSPGRVVGTIRQCGGAYLMAVALAAAAMFGHVGFLLGPGTFPSLARVPVLRWAEWPFILLPALAGTMYVTHLFTWQLALLYRAHHDTFPWLAQRHIPTARRTQPSA